MPGKFVQKCSGKRIALPICGSSYKLDVPVISIELENKPRYMTLQRLHFSVDLRWCSGVNELIVFSFPFVYSFLFSVQRTLLGSSLDIGWLQRTEQLPIVEDGTTRFMELLYDVRYLTFPMRKIKISSISSISDTYVFILLDGLLCQPSLCNETDRCRTSAILPS